PPAPAAGEADPHPPLVELRSAPQENALVEVREEADLVERPAPVLGREGVDREVADAELQGALDGLEERLLAGLVALGALEPAPAGPAAVAVHDHRHVAGNPRRVEVGREHEVRRYRPGPATGR